MKLHKSIQSLTLGLDVTLFALAFAQALDKSGIMLGDTVVITAKVEVIDKQDRTMALRGSAENVLVLEVDDAVEKS
jgi:hypothetical protein